MKSKPNKKGRNPLLIEARDRKLIERYYYWTEVKRRRFDDVLIILEWQEFFISESRILTIIKKNNQLLNELINAKKSNK